MKSSLTPFKAYYFFIFAALAFFAPYLTLYYERLGLDGGKIGILAALPPIFTFVSAPILGALTDITQQHKRILGFSIILVVAGILIISVVNNFWGLIPGVIVYAFFFAPTLPIIDCSVLEILGPNRDQYGKQRLWGAIGWGVLAPFAGVVVERGGLQASFYWAAGFFMVLFFISQFTPLQGINIQPKFWGGLKQLLSSWQVLLFFFVVLIGGMGLAMVHNYLFLYLHHIGAKPTLMGVALTIATLSELFIMYYSDRLLVSWKSRGLILFGLGMISIRLLGYSATNSSAVALALQFLHGPTFAAIWMAGVAYVTEIAPPGLGNTAQGMFTGIVMGLGSALGAFIGGFLYQSVGFSRMFLYAGFTAILAFCIFWVGCQRSCGSLGEKN